ncbi:putative 5-formyltetrahydrofolate cyclo-ligase [Phaeomoniella chlamydospora]|uniref:5-formyltetrahydrofolate cyclo-ligase n=1 Tax=Phaeomoniella chlamydospora TaxID=158046 RepID=A0A0G2DWC2_PHACM|nr:putative 5-formyltetrahydrofolate cyclo-ligase [Phaeomoniella chlamydospora]
MATLGEVKQQLRKSIQIRLNRVSHEDVSTQSQKVTNIILAMPEYQAAKSVAIYLSMPTGEVSTRDIVANALSQGKKVYVPYLVKNSQQDHAARKSKMAMLSLHPQEDLKALKPDKWGIPSLDPTSVGQRDDALGKGKLDMILVPGMAFDHGRRRLGHGKGFYDRFLWEYRNSLAEYSEHPKMPSLVALALRQQILPIEEKIPVGEHDWPMDVVVSAPEA